MKFPLLLILLLCFENAENSNKEYEYGEDIRLLLSYFNKKYFKYFKLGVHHYNRTRYDITADFEVLMDISEKSWIDVQFYHLRNNRYNLVPIGRGFALEDFLNANYFRIGTALTKQIGKFPLRPKKYSLRIPTYGDTRTLEVPMFGDYKLSGTLKYGNIHYYTIDWMGGIQQVVKKKKP